MVYSSSNAEEEIKLFANAASKELVTVEGGAYFLSATSPNGVGRAVLEFVAKHRD